jgi:hypothetical protein
VLPELTIGKGTCVLNIVGGTSRCHCHSLEGVEMEAYAVTVLLSDRIASKAVQSFLI